MKVYQIPMLLIIRAADEKLAAGGAELAAFTITEVLRKQAYHTDEITTMMTNGCPQEIKGFTPPLECYKRDLLIAAYGKDAAIRFLNNAIDKIYP